MHNIWTPFDKCTCFEPRILFVIDKYLIEQNKLSTTHLHWLVALGLSDDYQQAFQNACCVSNLHTVQVLYANVSDKINSVKNMACIQAATHGHLDIVQYLVSLGADITAKDNTNALTAKAPMINKGKYTANQLFLGLIL